MQIKKSNELIKTNIRICSWLFKHKTKKTAPFKDAVGNKLPSSMANYLELFIKNVSWL